MILVGYRDGKVAIFDPNYDDLNKEIISWNFHEPNTRVPRMTYESMKSCQFNPLQPNLISVVGKFSSWIVKGKLIDLRTGASTLSLQTSESSAKFNPKISLSSSWSTINSNNLLIGFFIYFNNIGNGDISPYWWDDLFSEISFFLGLDIVMELLRNLIYESTQSPQETLYYPLEKVSF